MFGPGTKTGTEKEEQTKHPREKEGGGEDRAKTDNNSPLRTFVRTAARNGAAFPRGGLQTLAASARVMRREGESAHSTAKQPPLGAAASIKGSNAQTPDFAKSGSPTSLVVEPWTPHLHIAVRRRCSLQNLGRNS